MDVRRTDIDGVAVFWVESPLPFVCHLLVRMGRVDESLHTAGLSHLFEHLVLSTEWPRVEFNATVTPMLTHFWFAGDADEATRLLTETIGVIGEPPLARVPREREILRTEAFGRGRSQLGQHSALRFGARGLGLVDVAEYGLQRATRDVVRDWFSRFGVAGNVAVAMTGTPPEGLRFDLPAGAVVPPPEPEPIPYLRYPSSYADGPDGAAGVSMLVQRSHAIVAGLEIASERLRKWLRHQEGATYHVGTEYDPVTRDLAQLVVWADCRPERATLVRNALVAAVDDLASNGPTDEEMTLAFDAHVRRTTEQTGVYDVLVYAAGQHLAGDEAETAAQMREARRALVPADIACAFEQAFESLIVVAPYETPHLGGRFTPYPLDAPVPVEGKRFSPTDKDRKETLVVGDAGVAIHGEHRRAASYAEAEAFLTWDDGSVLTVSPDGFYVLVDPAEWKNGKKAADAVREHVDPARAIDVSTDPPPFEDPRLVEGAAAFDAQQWTRARDLLEAGLEADPGSAEGWAMLAWAAAQTDASGVALEAARKAADLDRNNVWSARFLAQQLQDAGQSRAAVRAIREALRRGPVDLEVLTSASDILSKAGHYADARSVGRRAAELAPDDSSAWFAFGWSARYASDWEAAESALRRAVELDPKIPAWHNNLGVLLLELGRTKEALASFDRALDLDESFEWPQRNRVNALHRLGKTKDAARVWAELSGRELTAARQALRDRPEDVLALDRLVRALIEAERDDEALDVAKRAVQAQPTATRHAVVSEVHDWLGDYAASRAALEDGMALDPSDGELLDALAWIAAVTGDGGLGEFAAGRIEELYGERRALAARGQAAISQERWAEAEELFDRLLELRPSGCCAHAWRGVAKHGQGRLADAQADAKRVLELTATRCATLRHLEHRFVVAHPA